MKPAHLAFVACICVAQVSSAQGSYVLACDKFRESDRLDRFLGMERRTAAYVIGGVGVAGMLVGTVAGISGLYQESIGDGNCSDKTTTCNQKGFDANESARSLATVSTIGFVIGIAGLGAGTYLYVTAAPEKTESARSGGFTVGWKGKW